MHTLDNVYQDSVPSLFRPAGGEHGWRATLRPTNATIMTTKTPA